MMSRPGKQPTIQGVIAMMQHQYIERDSGKVVTERLFGDRMVRLLYHGVRENNAALFRLLTSSRSSHILGLVNFDRPVLSKRAFLAGCGIDLSECLDPPEQLDTPRKIFERRIRYQESVSYTHLTLPTKRIV